MKKITKRVPEEEKVLLEIPKISSTSVSSSSSLSSSSLPSYLFLQLFQYLLFMRQQIPETLPMLKKSLAAAERAQKRKTFKQRKAEKLIESTQKLTAAVEEVFKIISPETSSSSRTIELMIMFEASTFNPKEIITIIFKLDNADSEALITEKIQHEQSSKMIRALLARNLDLFMTDLKATKVFVMMKAPHDSEIPDFVPKHNFKPNKTKPKTRLLHIQFGSSPSASSSLSHPEVVEPEHLKTSSDENQMMWYSFIHPILGIQSGGTEADIMNVN